MHCHNDDSNIELQEKRDVYTVSADLWKKFAGMYHADLVIKLEINHQERRRER